ncbi:MAG: putative concanavalin A-like lectin/glucanases superfamily protein [Prokaryotic dsDNA virus sp.]|jgi:hypothetical protein|nr:MAG: putative concanavalin A-like lectin/glucanases superfamily protein [Prokaryotic dsDNA virus sp.]|tara:strand:+ start:9469 stop:11874 length:2406 start_codon:yes stop_codon:yes gene_type:complete
MSFNKKFFATGGIVASSAECTTDTTDKFGDSKGKALYSMDYDASDTSGVYNGTATDVDFGVGGQINYGARFNGSSSKIVTGIDLTSFSSASLSVWVYWTGGNFKPIFGGQDNISGSTTINRFNTGISDSGGRLDYISKQGDFFRTTDMSLFSSNAWNHIVITDDFTTNITSSKLYVNGQLEDSFARIVTNYGGAINTNLYIGQGKTNSNGQEYLTGSLDQVRIFSSVLTSTQVSTLYAETACVHTATANTADFPSGATAVAHYPLDNSAEDNKGTNDGTESGDVEYRFGKYGQAAVFDGTDGCEIITTINNSVLPVNSSFSVSAWFRYDAVSGTTSPLGMTDTDSSFDGWAFFASTNNFSLAWNGAAPGFTTGSTHTIQVGIWFNAVFTYDGSGTSKMYIDGSLQGTRTSTVIDTPASTTFLRMGDGDVWGTHNGAIDQVRIFSTELTSDQVTELYNEKPETDTSNFKSVLYEGTGATQYISNIGYNLDVNNGGDGGMLWIKERTSTSSHRIVDSVRGDKKRLFTNNSGAETTTTEGETLEANGFFIGADNGSNESGQDYVAWVWKAGGDAVTGTGSGVTNVSISANTDAGFSIVKYTGGDSASDTVNHGLTDAEVIILKDLDDGANNWRVWHKDLTANHWLYLNLPNAEADAASDGGIRNVDSNSFGFINSTSNADSVGIEGVNSDESDYIAYVWKSISGYSKMGTYEGLGTSVVTETNLGFKPSWVLIKNIDNSANWNIYDSRIAGSDVVDFIAYPNLPNTIISGSHTVTMQTDGFQVSATDHLQNNKSGSTYLYMAFK